jgi:hypothetical protein
MLRIEIRESADSLVLKLEGRFAGDDAKQARTLAVDVAERGKLVVDLTEVVFVDATGEEALSVLGQFGVEFIAPNSYLLDVCERLNLPLVPNGHMPVNESGAPGATRNQVRTDRFVPRKR